MNKNINLTTIIQNVVTSELKNLHTCLPAVVKKFDSEKQTLEAEPLVKKLIIINNDKEGKVSELELPPCINVPVIVLRAGGYCLTFPIKKGDECLLFFSERDIEAWKKTGRNLKPETTRHHCLSDAFALVGIYNDNKLISEYDNNFLELRSDNSNVKITLNENGQVIINADNKLIINAPLTQVSGDINCSGVVNAENLTTNSGFNANTHKHILSNGVTGTFTP